VNALQQPDVQIVAHLLIGFPHTGTRWGLGGVFERESTTLPRLGQEALCLPRLETLLGPIWTGYKIV